jgi:hypothetical protein
MPEDIRNIMRLAEMLTESHRKEYTEEEFAATREYKREIFEQGFKDCNDQDAHAAIDAWNHIEEWLKYIDDQVLSNQERMRKGESGIEISAGLSDALLAYNEAVNNLRIALQRISVIRAKALGREFPKKTKKKSGPIMMPPMNAG